MANAACAGSIPRPLAKASAVAAALAVWLFAVTPAFARDRDVEIVHVVAKGQTLGRIAKRYHTSVDSIREVNNLRRGQPIHPGLSLVIPEKGREAEAAKKAEKLRKGDDAVKGKPDAPRRGKSAGTSGKRDKDDGGAARGFARRPKRPGFVRMTRGSDRFEAQVLTRHGRLVPASLAGLGRILRFYPTNAKVAVDPRLATLVGMVSNHFGGRPIRVVSGFRPYTPAQYTAHSNHNVGRAVDFSVDGVPNSVVRDFCRTFRNAGVGYYPNSSFVHLDVRAAKAYWVDYSRSGEAPRYDSPGASAHADEAAGDVEPHVGPEDGIPPGGGADEGSLPTSPGPIDASEKKDGNTDTVDHGLPKSDTEGHK